MNCNFNFKTSNLRGHHLTQTLFFEDRLRKIRVEKRNRERKKEETKKIKEEINKFYLQKLSMKYSLINKY